MPGRDRLKEIVKEQVYAATTATGHLTNAAEHPGQTTPTDVAQHVLDAHEAIDKAADAVQILVREGEG